ncbi:MAG TPA: hypothetical protein PLJ21_08430, partial [Pseudobdellovibrionaceae bacterium]|nr:hypothetical protein [Pseudobdellovibrionaceae bacterium]
MKTLKILLFSFSLIGSVGFSSEIDLSNQFSNIHKQQNANTCYIHTGIGLIEAALHREGFQVTISDEAVILNFINKLLDSSTRFSSTDWLESMQSILVKNIYYFQRGKTESLADYGLLNKELIYFLTQLELPIEQEFTNLNPLKDKFKSLTDRYSMELLKTKSPIPIPEMMPEELLKWEGFSKIRPQLQSDWNALIQQIPKAQTVNENLQSLKIRAVDLQISKKNHEMNALLETLANAPTLKETEELNQAKRQCSETSVNLQNQLEWFLKHQIPLAVGIYPAGVEFGPDLNNLKTVYKTSHHALILTGIKNIEGKKYYLLRDSGFIQGSSHARFPVEEGCRILNAVALVTKNDIEKFKKERPPKLNSIPSLNLS